jgi:CrcB protein
VIRSLVFVAVGGALGALARYGVSNGVHALWPMRFPLATLLINVGGSLAMGVLYVLIAERLVLHADWRSIAMVGFLGAFTTYSTFSLETVTLLEHGHAAEALAYVAASVLACVGGAWLGMVLARLVWTG